MRGLKAGSGGRGNKMDAFIIGLLCAVFAIGAGVLIGLSKWFDKLMKDIGGYLYND